MRPAKPSFDEDEEVPYVPEKIEPNRRLRNLKKNSERTWKK